MAIVSIFTVGDQAANHQLSSADPDLAMYRVILGRPPVTHVSQKAVEGTQDHQHRGVFGAVRGFFGAGICAARRQHKFH
jgi:hypothetical protein